MKILGRSISKTTETHIIRISNELKRPVEYHPIHDSESNHGHLDPSDHSKYIVALSLRLTDSRHFETNILHELLHAVQIDKGYPTTENKNTGLLHSNDRLFTERLGAQLNSFALDYDVNTSLINMGYEDSVKFFYMRNYNRAIELATTSFFNMNDRINFAGLVMSYAQPILLYTNPNQDEKLLDSYNKYKRVILVGIEARNIIRDTGVETPLKAAICACKTISLLDIWNVYYVKYGGLRLRTHSESKDFLSQYSEV